MIRSTHARHTSTLSNYNRSIDHSLRLMHYVHYWFIFVVLFVCLFFIVVLSAASTMSIVSDSHRVIRIAFGALKTINITTYHGPQPDWLIRIIIDFILGRSLHCRSSPLTMFAFDYCSRFLFLLLSLISLRIIAIVCIRYCCFYKWFAFWVYVVLFALSLVRFFFQYLFHTLCF